MNIADRIQYLRKQKGYSQEELADKVGVSRQAVSKWESEQSTPDLEKVIAMSELFEVTTDYILKGIEPVSTTNRKTVKTLYLGFVLIFATIAGICLRGAQPGKETSARKFPFSQNKNREQNGRSLMQKVPYLEKRNLLKKRMIQGNPCTGKVGTCAH